MGSHAQSFREFLIVQIQFFWQTPTYFSVFYQLISVQSDQNFSFVSFILFARASPIIYFVISLIKFRLAVKR